MSQRQRFILAVFDLALIAAGNQTRDALRLTCETADCTVPEVVDAVAIGCSTARIALQNWLTSRSIVTVLR